ncbi:hypothetical protein LSAT2_002717 [Lamellibrachia satsuma]|nr:hypothetical protein LSAT2_002717 [Lamellibrachia satsuma]
MKDNEVAEILLDTYEKYDRFTSKTSTPKHVVTPQDLLVSPIGGISGESGTLTAEIGVGPISTSTAEVDSPPSPPVAGPSHKADTDISVCSLSYDEDNEEGDEDDYDLWLPSQCT